MLRQIKDCAFKNCFPVEMQIWSSQVLNLLPRRNFLVRDSEAAWHGEASLRRERCVRVVSMSLLRKENDLYPSIAKS